MKKKPRGQEKEKMTLASLRELAGLSQKELADILGVTDQTVSNWEKGRAVPKFTVRQVVQLLSVLPCTLLDLAQVCDEIERQTKVNKPKSN